MKGELLVHEDPKSPISEIFRTLRTNIQFTYTKNSLKTILITSTLPGEGKSWVASNLAVAFAQAGKKVALVDADMRKGRQYSIFGVSPRPGLSNYLSGVDESMSEEASDDLRNYIQETSVERLYVMSAGNIPPNPSELLASNQMESLIKQLRDIFDIVMIDGTPNQLVTDSLILARMVDSTVIVAASNQTKKEDLKRIVKNIKNVGGKIAGVIVNKMPISVKKYNQSYYYGSTDMSNARPTTQAHSMKKIEIVEEPEEETQKEIEEENKPSSVNDEIPQNTIVDETLLNRKIEVEAPDISLEKTADILKQVNEYLENEKKKLN